jgi:hypothetical protein
MVYTLLYDEIPFKIDELEAYERALNVCEIQLRGLAIWGMNS